MEHLRNNFFLFIFLQLFFTIPAPGAPIPFTGYVTRIEQAQSAVGGLIENDSSGEKLRRQIAAIKRFVPPQQEVQFKGRVVRVDNSWLHNAIDEVAKKPGDDAEARRAVLKEISDRLSALQERFSGPQRSANADDSGVQLDRILARSEYRLDEERDATVKKFLNNLWEDIRRLLNRLVASPGREPELPDTGGLFRILLVIIVLVASATGALYLSSRLRRRRQQEKENYAREILGEQLAGDITSGDLLVSAAELAKQGDYRTAIRRVYIALLLDLERRGKLPLHPSKTNRDYLNALRSERLIYPSFSTMTGTFEQTWYGQRGATEEEFNGFVSRYDEAIRS